MPQELVDFFFDIDETVLTKEQIQELQAKQQDLNKDPQTGKPLYGEDENYIQAVCTSGDGTISYITCHIFYEDLALLQEVLSPLHE
jgi:hypothetical protein